MPTRAQAPAVPRLTYLRIKNYRALRDVEFRDLTPLTVLIGPNGSGKSTVLDALDFLAEAVRGNLVGAWEARNRFAGMRTRGSEGNIEFEVEIIPAQSANGIKYLIEITEIDNIVFLAKEQLSIEMENKGYVQLYSSTHSAHGGAVSLGNYGIADLSSISPAELSIQNQELLIISATSTNRNQLAVGILSVYENQARDTAEHIVEYFSSYRYVHLTDKHLKGYSDAGPREKLSPNGDNLPNVLYYLYTKHPEVLEKIANQMRKWVPGLSDIAPEITSDERILLRFKDAQFEKTMPAQYMSGGTMRLTAMLTLLHETEEVGLLGIEEPENELHPQLLYRLTEAFEKATEKRQLFVTTHSPLILDALAPEQVWVMYRGADGYAHATRTADMPNVPELAEDGSMLGYLWTSNTFTVGDPQAPFKANPDAR